jgi:ferritin
MHELYSAYLYLSMSAYFDANNLTGFAHWMRVQAGEEQGHAMKFYDFIYDRGGKVTLQAIDQPPTEFKSPKDIFAAALDHEKKVTARIDMIYDLAIQDNDHASQSFLKWFVDEQVEEEKNATQILEMLKMAGDSPNLIFLLNHQLGERAE